MTKKWIVLGACFMFLKVGAVSAKTPQKHVWELGISVSNIAYKEPGVMEEAGMFFGINGSYAYHNKIMLKSEGKFAWGQVDYDGAYANGAPLTIDDIPDYMWEFRGLCGYDFPKSNGVIFTPYVGIGYRYLNDGLQKQSGGYERESRYYYSPIGIKFVSNSKTGWSVGATLEYDIFWGGLQVSHFSDSDPKYNDFENDQTGGYGCRASVKFQKKNIIIEPYLNCWAIDVSKTAILTYDGAPKQTMVEPDNHSVETGITFAIKF